MAFSRDTLFVSLVLLMVGSSYEDNQCSRSVNLSVRSNRNQTGHWTTHVFWNQSIQQTQQDNKASAPLLLNLNQRVVGSSGVEWLFTETELTISPSVTGAGYGLVPGAGRYKFHSVAANWLTAQKTCLDDGGNLAVIRSKAQEDALVALFARHPTIQKTDWDKMAWLGFHDQFSEGDFVTVWGESFAHVGYANWEPGKPDNLVYAGWTVDSDCGAMNRSGKILDLPCTGKYAFICEQNV